MKDKTLQAILKLKDEITKPLSEAKKASEDFNKAFADTKKTLDDCDDAMKKSGKSSEEVGKGFKGMGDEGSKSKEGVDKVGEALKAITAQAVCDQLMKIQQAFIDTGKKAIEAYEDVKKGTDNLVMATGATGKTAQELKANFKNVAGATSASFEDVGSSMGEVNTRFGFTGKELEKSTQQFLKFAKITGSDATEGVKLISRAMGDAGIKSSEYASVTDMVAKACQASGVSMEGLTTNLAKFGAPMRALGYDTKESIALFSTFEKSGVNTEIAFSGMKKAIANWGAQGKDGRKEFSKTLEEIKKCPDIASATAMAIEVFGQKAGSDLADAIQGGRFSIEEMEKALADSGGTVSATYEEMRDGMEIWKEAQNNAKIAVGEFGGAIMEVLKPAIQGASEALKGFSDWFKGLDENTKKTIATVALVVTGIVVLGTTFLTITLFVMGFTAALSAIGGAAAIAGAAMAILTSPITIAIGVIVAIIGVVALMCKAWKTNFGGIQDKTKAVMTFVKNKINSIKDVFKQVGEKCKEFGNKIKDTWEGIKNFLKNPIKGTVDLIQKNRTEIAKGNGKGKRSAYGTRRVFGNDKNFKLHDGEMVLNRVEADRYRKGESSGGNIHINISNMEVRNNEDIELIANKLLSKIKDRKRNYGGAY